MSDEPHRITQKELKDLGRDLERPKCTAGLLVSRLQQWKLLDNGVKISAFRFPPKHLAQFFQMEGNLLTYSNVDGLVTAPNINHSPEEW
jgi:predicted RNA-binding protein associated with RNAse of E/G family